MKRRNFLKGTLAGCLGATYPLLSEAKSPSKGSMKSFDKQYFFIRCQSGDRIPILTPDQDTADKPYQYERLPLGQKPLIFYNGWLEECLASGNIPLDPPPDVLFDGDDLVVREHIAKKLDDMDIPNLAIQPAIYIDHKKKWHEDYWFLTFTEQFDCWDRKRSKYDPEPRVFDSRTFNVYVTLLDDEVLKKTPLHDRLLFKMGHQMTGPVLAHESIADLFRMEGVEVISVEKRAKMND